MNALDAVEEVLQKAQKPLHAREITDQLLKQGLWSTAGRTPDATIHAYIAVDIKKNGESSRFQRTGKGLFALRSWGLTEYSGKVIKKGSQTPQQTKDSEPPNSQAIILGRATSFTDAAEQVLERSGNREPMHYGIITK